LSSIVSGVCRDIASSAQRQQQLVVAAAPATAAIARRPPRLIVSVLHLNQQADGTTSEPISLCASLLWRVSKTSDGGIDLRHQWSVARGSGKSDGLHNRQ